MRHGEAEQVASNDSLRALTSRGCQEAFSAGEWLTCQQTSINVALISPFLRTQQTYSQVIQTVSVEQSETMDFLRPEENAMDVQDYIDGLLTQSPELTSVLLVSHMPLVCYLVERFTGDYGPLFATASIVEIDYDGPGTKGKLSKCYHVPTID